MMNAESLLKLISAWSVLRSHQKFIGVLEERRGESLSSVNSTESVGQSSTIPNIEVACVASLDQWRQERPIGRKRAKRAHQKRDHDAKKTQTCPRISPRAARTQQSPSQAL